MKMSGSAGKAFLVLMIGITLLATAGCGVSLFDSLDQVEIDTGDADSLLKASESNSFYDQLEEDDGLKDDVIQTLKDDGSAESQALIAQIEFETTPAGEVVNGVFSTALEEMQQAEDDPSYEPDAGSILSSIFSSDITDDPVTFDQTIDSLIAMSEALNAAGAAGYDGDDGADLAQMAVVASGISVVLDAMDGTLDGTVDTSTSAVDDFQTIVTDSDPAGALEDYWTDPAKTNPFDGSDIETVFDTYYSGSYALVTGSIDLTALGM